MTSRRRLSSLAVGAAVLAVAACGAAQGQPRTVGDSTALTGIGETPEQLESGDGALPTAPPASEVAPPNIQVVPDVVRPDITDSRVFMIGDSVLQAMAIGDPDPIDLYVGALGWDITVDAVTGRFTDEGLSVLRSRRDEVHQVLVGMLGNNYDGDENAFRDDVNEILEMFPDVRMFVMFTVPLYDDKQAEVNLVLKEAAGRDKRLLLLDWESATRTYDGSLRSDDVHPTEFGTDVLAQMLGAALGRSPDGDPTVTLPIVGSSTRPRLTDGTNTNKDENNSTPRPGDTDSSISTSAPPETTRPRGTSAPTTTRPSTAPTRPSSSTTTTTRPGATTTTRPGASTTTSSSSTSSSSSSSSSSTSSSSTSSSSTSSTSSSTSSSTTSSTTSTTAAPPPTTAQAAPSTS